jgi:hypothetical protein
MNFAWMAPIPLEIALQGSPYTSGIFAMPGDSMVIVNKYGRRVANEKAIYNELTHIFFQFDPQKVEYPNLLLFLVWDQRTAELWAATETIEDTKPSRLALDNYGNVIYEDFHVIKGETIEDLTQNIKARLEKLAPHTGGFALDKGFAEEVHRTIARFNQLAATGKDLDFQRGENPIELIFNGEARPGNDTGNPTMYPISESGLLRHDPRRGHPRYQGRAADQHKRSGPRRGRRAHSRALRRWQLRRLRVGARLLGGWCDARTHPDLRIPGRKARSRSSSS